MVGGARRAVFLDRDGVLSVPEFRDGRSFAPRRLDDFRLYDDAGPALTRLNAAGWALVVATNQPDVGNGLVAREVVDAMHARLAAALPLDAIEVCCHRAADRCDCRKPRPGMLLRAARRLGIDCTRSVMIGDRASDVAAGQAAGCRTIFIDRGYRDEDGRGADHIVATLAAAASVILAGDA